MPKIITRSGGGFDPWAGGHSIRKLDPADKDGCCCVCGEQESIQWWKVTTTDSFMCCQDCLCLLIKEVGIVVSESPSDRS